jgi:ribosomal protein S18 acetylase RimI-like enzyme
MTTTDGPTLPRAAWQKPTAHPLDDPVGTAITGPQAPLGMSRGRALRYQADVAPFAALPDDPTEQDWADLAGLGVRLPAVLVSRDGVLPPPGWVVSMELPGVQLVGEDFTAAPEPEAVRLTAADVPEMLDLVARTRPGPFLPRTIEMGAYLGIRREGRLVAMAGERMRPPGWTEISAVCTDPDYRGEGLATRLMRAVSTVIRDRGDLPFLHAATENINAIRLYLALGFELRRDVVFVEVSPPDLG